MLIGEQADSAASGALPAASVRPASASTDLADFDWQFNAAAIDRVQIEALPRPVHRPAAEPGAGGPERSGKEPSDPGDRPGVLCLGYRVRYTTSAECWKT